MDKRILRKIRFVGQTEGESMIPVIYPKDGVYIKPTTVRQLNVNDIITFKQENKFVTHRIIYKNKGYFITKGDNNFQSDGKVYPRSIIGKVERIKRGNKVFNLEDIYLVQSTIYLNEIVKIKRATEKKNIDLAFLKGLPLHLYFERSYPEHFYFDCDILINKKDLAAVTKILVERGFKKIENDFLGNSKFLGNIKVEVLFLKQRRHMPIFIDLHLEPVFLMTQFSGLEALYPKKLIDKFTEELLNNKQQITINDKKFFILNTKYLILYLVLHIFHHNFRGAFRYEFLHKIIVRACREQKNNNIFLNMARKINEYRLENFVYPVFVLLKKYYKTSIPSNFFKQIKPPGSYFVSNIFKVNIFDDEPRLRAGINRFLNILLLSPNPWWKKVFAFLNSQVVYSSFRVIWMKLRSKIIPSRRQNIVGVD